MRVYEPAHNRPSILEHQVVSGTLKGHYHKMKDFVAPRKLQFAAAAATLLGLVALARTDLPSKAFDFYKKLGPSIDDVADYIPAEPDSPMGR